MVKAVLYCRVDRPATEFSKEVLETQKRQLEAYARKKGMEIVGVYTDDGFPGINLERPGLQAMMRDVNDGKAGAVLVVNRSRLFRGPMPEELRALPAKLHAIQEISLER